MTMKHLTKSAVALLAAALAAALIGPGVAWAAPSAATTATAPLATGDIGIQVGPAEDANSTVVLVDLVLPKSVKLPARVRLPIPPGANVMWAGEILGGSASADPERSFTTAQGRGAQYAEFTISQSHQAQIDTRGLPRAINGATVSTAIEFVQSVPSSSTSFSVRTPPGATDIQISPPTHGTPDTNAAGEHLYLMATRALALGDKVPVTVSYRTGGSAGSSANQTMLVLVVVVALIAVVIALVVVQRARSAASAAADAGEAQFGEDSDVGFDDTPYDQVPADTTAAQGPDGDESRGESDGAFDGVDDAFSDGDAADRDESQ